MPGPVEKTAELTSEVFIVHNNKVLLRRHRRFEDKWLSIGGHVEVDEDPAHAAIREVKEEMGLDITLYDGHQRFHDLEAKFWDVVPPVAVGVYQATPERRYIICIYFATSKTDAVIPEDPGDEWRWLTKEEILQMDLVSNIRSYALGALETLAS